MTVGAAALLLLLALDLASVDEALLALERGERLEGRVTPDAALTAAARIGPFTSPAEVTALARVARAGGAEAALGRALVDAVRALGPSAPAAAGALAGAQVHERDAALAAAPADLPAALLELAGGDAPCDPALALLARVATPEELAAAVQRWATADEPALAAGLLRHVGAARRPAATLSLLSLVEVGPELVGPLGDALAALVARDDGAAAEAVARAARGVRGPGGALLRSLGAVGPARHEAASALVVEALDELEAGDDDLALSAAITAAGELLLPRVLPALPGLAADQGRARVVRRAAVEALVHVGYRDAPTIELLIGLLRDPDAVVAAEAHRTLLRKAGVRLDARPDLWEAWRRSRPLPEHAPEDDETRLLRERALRDRLRE
ncbi:MAG: hypothetical protein M9894_17205 [Planctomycetes bacterium]|nr:hypothetical protein [Planctomycetota bacterium]